MKLRSGLSLLVLASCATGGSSAETLSAREYFDRCAGAGWNVTYQSALESELRAARVADDDPAGKSAEELEAHLDRELRASGFEAKRVGTPELKMFLIQRAS